MTPWEVRADGSTGVNYDKLIDKFGSSRIDEVGTKVQFSESSNSALGCRVSGGMSVSGVGMLGALGMAGTGETH